MNIVVVPQDFTVGFEECDGSPRVTFASDYRQIKAEREFLCKGRNAYQLAKEFIGYYEYQGATTVIHEPHNWPDISPDLIAIRADMEPFGKAVPTAQLEDTRFNEYDDVKITVSYSIPQIYQAEQYGGQVIIAETLQGASEFLTLPSKGLYWGTGVDKELIDDFDAPAKFNHLTEWTYHISNAREYPAGIQTFPGYINSATVVSTTLNFIFPTGTLLCGNNQESREIRFDGATYNITLRFLYKNNGTLASPRGWNFFPRTSKTGADVSWERITDGTDNKNIYPYADFGPAIV